MFMDAAPGIAPIIEDLAAERVAADAPIMLVTLSLHDLMAAHDVVDVGGFVGEVVDARLVAADAEEDMVVDMIVTAVEPVERPEDVGLLVGVDLVRAAEAEHLAVEAEHVVEVRRHHHEMADALDVARARLHAVEHVAAPGLVLTDLDRRALA